MTCTHCGGRPFLDRLLGDLVCVNCGRVVGAKPHEAQKPLREPEPKRYASGAANHGGFKAGNPGGTKHGAPVVLEPRQPRVE